ncbi:methylcobamide--CoM methyltransferase MtbA [Acetobacterium fimetarium]|uniref:Methylcobamide--CoM methyltransferase MtbA n=1 Tax=Acetobacterium fimetarium TaxID=52691 RepID=A0ABR6X002_9FIRM|nr:uroporphyrinogen decarboxylase family protein [Acetobacterium fimetarium]MBC3805679.1 methylcobamide--CoM methyltransferase MtbA [Acetobacterium fimetarium]
MNSFERTMAAISHTEPDRVPLFLLLSLYGAKEMGIPIKSYFSKPENIMKAQLKMKDKYRNDCIYTFFYAPIEVEAFGGEVIFVDDGPPNSGEPFIKSAEQISKTEVPRIEDTACLKRVLEATALIKREVGNETPIFGVVMSPFSLPVMQIGFEKYLELMYFRAPEFERLMQINQEFCVAWANAQLEAGATAICYFDPLASPNIIERDKYLATGHRISKQTIGRIKGPTATHLASGIALPVINDIIDTGSAVLGFSAEDDLIAIKKAAQNKICLLGNLNGVDMVNWSSNKVNAEVKNIIAKAGSGGGLILSDNHGEIPWQVPESVLLEISEAVSQHGTYPLKQV